MSFDQAQTVNSILGGALTIVQPLGGYRFSVDSILLARFAHPTRQLRILELGAGCGVVSVVLAALYQPKEIVAIEVQPPLAALIARNAVLNGTAELKAICADIRESIPELKADEFDYVVANPPYRAATRGRESPDAQRRISRGGGGATLREFIAAAARYVHDGGKLAIVFTASRTAELVTEMRQRTFEPKRIRFVHPTPGASATMILVEARKGGGVETIVEPPLFIYDSPGAYSEEARVMLTGIE
jgi:tRNA1Val (adenine37-N6)-methyltransferase